MSTVLSYFSCSFSFSFFLACLVSSSLPWSSIAPATSNQSHRVVRLCPDGSMSADQIMADCGCQANSRQGRPREIGTVGEWGGYNSVDRERRVGILPTRCKSTLAVRGVREQRPKRQLEGVSAMSKAEYAPAREVAECRKRQVLMPETKDKNDALLSRIRALPKHSMDPGDGSWP